MRRARRSSWKRTWSRPFAGAGDEALKARFRDSTKLAAAALRAYSDFLKTEKLPKADQNFGAGPRALSQDARRGVDSALARSPPGAGHGRASPRAGPFRRRRPRDRSGRKPTEIFAAMQHEHPTAETLIHDTAKNLEAIRQFLIDHDIISVPSGIRAVVAETPPYQRNIFAEMVSPGPLEKNSSRAFYYVTPPEKDWSEAKKEEWLTSFNYYTTDVVSIHEAYPGHYVHGLHLREGGVTKAEALFTSYAFTEGWAHYCEQMMLEQGFGAGGSAGVPPLGGKKAVRAAKYRMAQSDEALLRVCRLCVSIRMHCQGMTLDEATKFFQDNCYYEAAPARRKPSAARSIPSIFTTRWASCNSSSCGKTTASRKARRIRCGSITTRRSRTASRRCAAARTVAPRSEAMGRDTVD